MFSEAKQPPPKDEKQALVNADDLDQKLKAIKEADDIFEEALKHISVRDYANAYKCLEAILQKEKYHAKSLYTMGYLSEFATGEGGSRKALQTAVSWYAKAIANVPESDVIVAADITVAATKSIDRILKKLDKKTPAATSEPGIIFKVENKTTELKEKSELKPQYINSRSSDGAITLRRRNVGSRK